MANEIGNTEADAAIPEVWRRKTLLFRYAKSRLYGFVLHADDEVKGFGDIINIRTLPSVTVNDVGASGSVTNQALTYTGNTITVNKWKEATIDVVDKAQKQSLVDLLEDFSQQFGAAIAAQQDGDLTGLHGSITTNTVGATAAPLDPLSDDLILSAIQKLDDLDVPQEDRCWFFAPVAKKHLLKLDKFTLSYATGASKGGQVTGELMDLYGYPLKLTTKIATSTSRKNLLLHKECLGAATQKNFTIEKLARVKKSTPISGDVLYGVAALREDHGVVINTATS